MNITEITPNVIYDNGLYKFKNIFFEYVLTEEIEDKYLQVYSISDGETLENISHVLYGDTSYFWIFMILNDITDPIFDIAVPDSAIQRRAKDESYVDGVLDQSLYFSKYEELATENDTKRKIKVIKNGYLNKLLTELIKQFEAHS